jgi:hypothetical protein
MERRNVTMIPALGLSMMAANPKIIDPMISIPRKDMKYSMV